MKSTSAILKAAFDKKKKENKRVSMQSMANKLGISRSLLSQILSGKRSLPANKLNSLSTLLDLDKEKRDAIARSLLQRKKLTEDLSLLEDTSAKSRSKADWAFLSKDQFAVLHDWFYLAVLETTLLKTYDGSVDFLSRRLKLSKNEVESALQILKKKQLLEFKNGRWTKKHKLYDALSNADKKDIRAYHKASLRKASETLTTQIETTDVEARLITGMTLTVSKERIAWAQQKIAGLITEIAEESSRTSPDEVYQLSVQFFPLSR